MSTETVNPHLALQNFISEDKLDTALHIQEDTLLGQIISAWQYIQVTWLPPKELEIPPGHKNNLWIALWETCSWDATELGVACGMTPAAVMVHFQRARLLKLIYPNGRISKSAIRVLGIQQKLGYVKLTNELQLQTHVSNELAKKPGKEDKEEPSTTTTAAGVKEPFKA